jgi:hypothetical protein
VFGAPGVIPGAAVGLLALGVGVLLAVMTYRFSRGRSMVVAMIQTSFLPEKRARFLGIMGLQGALVLLIGIAWGLTAQGWIPLGVGNSLTALLLIGAIATVAALTWLGYAPTHLTSEERRSLAANAPAMFQSLVLAPLGEATGGFGTGTRSRLRVRVPPTAHSGATQPPEPGPPAA